MNRIHSVGSLARALAALALLASSALAPALPATAQGAPTCAPGDVPRFTFGFAILKAQLGDWMGDPTSCEFADPDGTGDVHQRTTAGLAFWRKSTNMASFTNGAEHWALVDGALVYWTGASIDPTEDTEPGEAHPCVGLGSCRPVVAQPEPTAAAGPPPEAPPVPTATSAPTSLAPSVTLSEADIADRVRPATVQVIVRTRDGTAAGSGVGVAQGILTNHHVVEGATSIEVISSGGRRVPATLLRSDERRDLALLEAQLDLPAAELAPAAQQRQGDQVLAFGYPRPDAVGSQGLTLTRGLVSAVRQNQDGVLVVQTDASVNQGSSGGPLVNMQGRVIGVISYGVTQAAGLNFAISTEEILGFLAGPAAIAPSPTPGPPIFRGDPQALAPVASDLPSGWRQTETERGDGSYFVLFERTEPSGLEKAIGVFVRVENSVPAAQQVWRNVFAKTLEGFVPFPQGPKVGEESFTQVAGGAAVLTLRVRNVNVALESLWSGPGTPPFDDLIPLANGVIGKVNAQAR